MKLTPEDHAKLQTKQLANIIRKLNAGKTLTAREEAILAQAQAADAGNELQTLGNGTSPSGGYAKTWDELADACHVDRRTITNARTNFGAEIKTKEKEWLKADGRKEIAWWVRFLADHGIQGRGVNNPDADFIDERKLRLKREQVQLDKAEFELAKAKESMLPVLEFETALSITVGQFRATLNSASSDQ